MALSADQLTDFRADVGDDGTTFTDDELNRLYTRASSDYTEAVILAFRQLLANANKLHDYRIAQSSESLSQVRKNIKDSLEYWETSVRSASQQVRVVAMRAVPPRDKASPDA